ncbi:ankyrin repeat domain-containing protein 26 isoform X7 [Synchiropus splendidus]|uniref:ankyrin repeat domain-containing protein 26 isoform X7 n=1 Tax=Synchiropus splendidus TaxID=270530 RepID=UPI00237D4077|nr:ankyrin repeat domain-containing protein 26 isoform X7 [Synchiropus splendidus]
MKKIFGFTKKKKQSSGASDNGSVLSAGYDVKEKDLGKVHKAAWLGDLAKLKQLAKKNDINQLDKENRTPLHIACACGHAEVVQFLVEGKAKLNLCDNQNRSALMKAVQGQHERCASILLENHAEPNLVDINGNTALHLAANIPSITTAASLLEHEADINAPNKEGFTPLTVAVREDHLDMAEFLIKEGAEVNFLDQDQRSPLMIAACNGQINMLRLLLKFGADVDLKDTKGWSADDHAVINGHHPCSLLINEHATQKRGGPSLTQDASKKGKKMSNPSKNAKAGFMLAGPATDKDEHGSDEAGRDFEDNSQSESLSRVSKSGADEWPSSEEEEESLLNEKKPKINLRKMIASKKGEECKQPPADSCASKTKQLDNEDEVDEEEEDEDEDDDEDEDEEEESDEDEEESEEESEEEDSEDEEDDDQPSSVDITDSDARNTAEDGASMPSPITGFIRLIPGVEEDCVVSAIRVESKLSDEEDSLSLPPSKPAAHLTHEAAEELGNESSKDREIASDGIKDGLFTHNKGLAYKTGGEGESEDTCFRDDDESLKQSGKRRSSWGSSLEEEDECEGKMEQSRLLSLTPSIAKPVKSVEDSQWDSSSECQEGASPAEQVNKMEESSACCHGKEEKNPVHAHDLAETDLIDEDNSWDDVSDKSEKCDRTEIVETQGSEVVKLEPKPEGWSSKSTEKGAKQVRECEGRDAAVVDDDVSDEDSDSLHQNLQYDFVSATVKVSDAGHDSDSDGHLNKDDAEAARLTAYVTLGDKNENLTEHGDVLADTQRNDSIDDDEEEEDEDDDVPEEDTDSSDDRLEESGDSFGVTAEDREGELSVENRRDFLSELGLETGEKVRESFDSESEHSRLPHKETMENPLESAAIDEDTKENLFYVPSFIRGEGCNRMLEPWRSVGMPRGSQGIQSPVVSNDNHSESTEATKKKENAKWEPLLSKRESHKSETDLMNELNLGDCDDLEDASDWDTASNASKTTLPGRRVASPGGDDVPAHAKTSINEEEEEALSPVPQRRLSLDKEVVSSSPPPVPIPQPRARRLVVPDSEESDWDQDHSSLSSNKASQAADQFPHTEAAHVPTETTPSEKGRLLLSQQELEVVREVRRSGSACLSNHSASHALDAEKHESSSRLRNEMSSQAAATPREQELESTVSTSTGAFNSPKMTSKHKQEGQVAPQAELVGGTRPQRMHRASPKVNGKQLNVFDDSTLSDMSDNEGSPRFPSSAQRSKKSEGLEKAEDLDELTQSSDTTTDDIDSPAAGYRHASLLIQKLDSATLDCKSIVKLQNMFHEYERAIQMEKSRHRHLSDKVSQLETERAELKKSLEEVKDLKSALERNQLELQTEVTNLSFQLKQEQENARNATMMYNTARGKLRRSEEQQQLELQDRQNMELTFRKLELELRTTANNMKQLEEDHNETQRLLALERSARTQQESLVSSHLRKQLEMEAENKRNVSKSHEALSQLTEASDRERELQQQITCLNEQLSILRTKFEHLQADSSLKETHFLEENETLKEQLEDAKRDVKLNSDSFFTSNHQIATLKSELTMTAARLENERQAHESLMTELESSQTRLRGALQEVERCQSALANSEKALLKEKEELQHLRDKLSGEASSHREEVTSLCQKLGKAEENANKMENEAHRVSIQLSEKSMLLEILQREKDQIAARAKELESALQSEKELVSRAAARHEATQERLAQAQSEGMLMRQQLEEAQNKGVAKERAVTDAQERFSDILSKLRSDSEEKVQLVEERNKELASKAADLREQVYKLEEEKNARVTELRELQQELTDSLKKLSMSEASLEVNSRYRNDLEEEKCRLLKDVDRLKAKLEESETQHVQAERRINSLKSRLDDREKELGNAAQKQQEALSASASSVTTIKQLEEAVQRLEIENVKLEAAAKQQSNKIEALQKEAQEATMRHSGSQGGRVKGHLEDLVSNLQSSKMTLEDQLNREVQKQSTLSHTAQDSQAMWEEEMKSSSKLGLRIAELEKNKGDLSAQVEIEKKKVKKFAELKKMSEARLEQELQRNTDLQKEMFRLRTLLKTAKRKLKDGGGAEFASPMSTLRTDMGHYSQGDGSLGKMKVDELQVQLDRETSQRRELERQNRDLKDQLASGRSLGAGSDQLERRKRQLEEEVLELRRRLDLSQTEQNQVDHYRREIEEKCRQELQQKIDQVNRFLQSQAESQEALDQMRSANEANLRSKYEQRILELEGELGRVRTIQHDSLSQRDSTRTELERFQQLYREELRLRKSLDAKLERANARLEKANSKLLQERSRSLRLGGGASLDVGSIGHYGMSLGHLNRSLGLGLTHLTPTTEGQKATVADYLAKMQSEFDKSITRELSDARAELDSASALRTELDPVSRANQEYLEVMKKNYMI